MKFARAWEQLLQGKKIRRQSWYPHYECIRLYNGEIIDFGGRLKESLDCWQMLKDDWEVVEE